MDRDRLDFDLRRYLLMVLALCLAISGAPAAVAQDAPQSFWAQGVAPYDPANPAQSRQKALEDLLRQAVLQAVGTVLDAGGIARHRSELETNILASPDRYVPSYQIVSETPEDPLYRLQGSVSIDMKALTEDLKPWLPQETPPEPEAPAGPAAGPGTETGGTQGAPMPTTVKDVLWAVAENWEGHWVIPQPDTSTAVVLAPMVRDEATDYLWTVGYPSLDSGPISDPSAPPWVQAVLDEARREGRRYAIVGTAAREGDAYVARCTVYAVPDGITLGIVEQRAPAQGSRHEAALQLAALLVPSLDQVLLPATPQVAPSSPAGGPAPGLWQITITGDHPYAAWLNLQALLADSGPGLQVASMTFQPRSLTVGLDSDAAGQAAAADGTRVSPRHILRLKEYDPVGRRLGFILIPAPESTADAAEETPSKP